MGHVKKMDIIKDVDLNTRSCTWDVLLYTPLVIHIYMQLIILYKPSTHICHSFFICPATIFKNWINAEERKWKEKKKRKVRMRKTVLNWVCIGINNKVKTRFEFPALLVEQEDDKYRFSAVETSLDTQHSLQTISCEACFHFSAWWSLKEDISLPFRYRSSFYPSSLNPPSSLSCRETMVVSKN